MLTIDLANKGNTVIYSMNEKNTITNTILYSLITNYTTDEVNIYALDFDNETLKIYEDAPQVGDVIFASEEEKVEEKNYYKNIMVVMNFIVHIQELLCQQ